MIKSSVKKELNCSIEKIWEIVTDNTQYAWRSDVSKIEIVDDQHFIEYSKNNFPTYFTITKKEEGKEYSFAIKNANIKGKWVGKFTILESEKVLIDFIEEIEVNGLIMKLFAKSYIRKQQKRYIKDLEKILSTR